MATLGFDLFWQDNGLDTYLCTGDECGYDGNLYCSNCGSERNEV